MKDLVEKNYKPHICEMKLFLISIYAILYVKPHGECLSNFAKDVDNRSRTWTEYKPPVMRFEDK